MSRSDDASARLRRDAEAFYAWAVVQVAREKQAWWAQPHFRSPYAYGSTRTP